MIQNQEFINDFVEEAKAHIETIESALLQNENSNIDSETINCMFRAVHSMKGTAGFFGLKNIIELSHAMENIFSEIRNGSIALNNTIVDIMLMSNDCLKNMIENIIESEEVDVSDLIDKLDSILCATRNANEKEAENKGTELENKTRIMELPISVEKENIPEIPQEPVKVDSMDGTAKTDILKKSEDSIRVHVSVLNELLNMASEMVLGRNQLLRTLDDYRKTIPGLSTILQNIDRLTSGMQEKIMQTRMQPMSNVFNKFPRIIRDVSRSLGKEIELTLEGSDVELDKSLIEALGDPLTHLVRNSADHGLETPEDRAANGKDRTGHITLKAFHEGGYVNVDVIDDGVGMDINSIAKHALTKGIIHEDDLSRMNEQDILKLIFKPGFSTAQKVSDISGRGVGMDVVKNNIEKLGGSVEIYTVPKNGTTVRLMLPLTLAIIQSLIIEVEGQKFALPQVNLKEIVRIKEGDKNRRIEFLHDSEVLRLRGSLLPIVHLADILGILRTYESQQTGEIMPERRKNFSDVRKYRANKTEDVTNRRDINSGVARILVLQIGSKTFGLEVDSIVASEETLVKPLPQYLKSCQCYSGVTIMGDGKAAMILDLEGLIRISGLSFRDENDTNYNSKADSSEHLAEKQNILLFKCSGNEIFSVDLSMISRIEEIQASDIEKIGDKEYIKFRGDTMQLIHLEDYLPINKGENTTSKKYVLVPKYIEHPLGIIANEIIDNVNINLVLNTDKINFEGLLGTIIYEGRITLLIDLYKILEKADPEHYSVSVPEQKDKGILLLVEDTPFFQRTVKNYLEASGYNVILASNGREALSILEDKMVDIVVSDIQMPVMDGFELARKIKDDKRFGHLPVVALTSMSGEKTKSQAYDSGFDFYEIKLDRNSIVMTIEAALKKAKGGESGVKGIKFQTG